MASGVSHMNFKDRVLGHVMKILQTIWEWKQDSEFEILVIGETGSGKSTLINNILGKVVAKVGETTHSETAGIAYHKGIVQDVTVRIHDTPGLGDSRDDPEVEEIHLREIEEIMRSGKIAMVIFCFNMSSRRMANWNINTFKTYHGRLQLDWRKVIIALTFADAVPGFENDKPPAEVYQSYLKQWKDHIGEVLREKVGVAIRDEDLRILPVTGKYTRKLPDGEEWFTPLWLSVMEVLDPHPMFRYLKMHLQNIDLPEELPSDEKIMSDAIEQIVDHVEKHGLSPDQCQPQDKQPPSDRQLSSSDRQTSSDRQPSSGQQPLLDPPTINLAEPENRDRFIDILVQSLRALLNIPIWTSRRIINGVTWVWRRLIAMVKKI